MEHGTLRYCANFWCAACSCSMGARYSMACSKKTHTHCPHACELKQWSKRPGSQTVTKKTCLTTVSAARVPSGFLCLDDGKRAVRIRPCCRTDTKTSSSTAETTSPALPNSSAVLFWRSSEPIKSDVVKLPVYNGKTNNTHTTWNEQ